jgi:pimeloyl-ACP methyl ester carboxylesterase
MPSDSDASLLDQPEILQFVFFPRQDRSAAPPGALDYLVSVEEGVTIGCRFYLRRKDVPNILYFHGNGEVVSDYDYVAPAYSQAGVNLFVADYRGYGASNGRPTFSNLVNDAHPVFGFFRRMLGENQCTGGVFVMGRSLGSIPALELAVHHGDQMAGLIIESGLGSMSSLMVHMGVSGSALGLSAGFPNVAKIRGVTVPTLIMHGEYDSLLPVTEAYALYENSPAQDKRLVIIPGAEHNDIMMVGGHGYFDEIQRFVGA